MRSCSLGRFISSRASGTCSQAGRHLRTAHSSAVVEEGTISLSLSARGEQRLVRSNGRQAAVTISVFSGSLVGGHPANSAIALSGLCARSVCQLSCAIGVCFGVSRSGAPPPAVAARPTAVVHPVASPPRPHAALPSSPQGAASDARLFALRRAGPSAFPCFTQVASPSLRQAPRRMSSTQLYLSFISALSQLYLSFIAALSQLYRSFISSFISRAPPPSDEPAHGPELAQAQASEDGAVAGATWRTAAGDVDVARVPLVLAGDRARTRFDGRAARRVDAVGVVVARRAVGR